MQDESNNTDKLIKERLSSIFANPHTANSIASLISSPRPAGWSKRSNAPYFKEEYAKEVRDCADQQLVNGKDVVFRYDTWCAKLNISTKTLYNRINQSILFLLERLDPLGKYKNWYNSVRIDCFADIGIIISVIKVNGENSLKPEFITPREELPVWKRNLDEWLESDQKRPFVKENLALNKEEILSLRSQFENLQGILFEVSSSSINIVKI